MVHPLRSGFALYNGPSFSVAFCLIKCYILCCCVLLHIELFVCLVVLLHDMFRTCFLILLRKTFRLVSRVALPRATFGGPGRPFFADGTRPSRGAYRIVGGGLSV